MTTSRPADRSIPNRLGKSTPIPDDTLDRFRRAVENIDAWLVGVRS